MAKLLTSLFRIVTEFKTFLYHIAPALSLKHYTIADHADEPNTPVILFIQSNA